MIILSKYSSALTNFTNFLSFSCTEMSRPKCPVTETARPNRPNRNGSHRNGSDGIDLTETARPKSRVPHLFRLRLEVRALHCCASSYACVINSKSIPTGKV